MLSQESTINMPTTRIPQYFTKRIGLDGCTGWIDFQNRFGRRLPTRVLRNDHRLRSG